MVSAKHYSMADDLEETEIGEKLINVEFLGCPISGNALGCPRGRVFGFGILDQYRGANIL
jgi:hypothetical protein